MDSRNVWCNEMNAVYMFPFDSMLCCRIRVLILSSIVVCAADWVRVLPWCLDWILSSDHDFITRKKTGSMRFLFENLSQVG